MAITRAQQVRQMLREGGRLGYRFGSRGYQGSDASTGEGGASKGRTSASKSTGPSFSDQGGGDDNRQTYSAIQTQTGKVKGGGAPITGSGGETIGFEDDRPSQKAIDNARKFQEEQNKKRSRAIFSNRSFNPFPLATAVFNKISNSRLAKYNNLLQRNNYLRTLPPDQQVAILERLAEEEEIGTTNPMGIDRNIQRGMGTYDYMDPEKVDKGFLGTGIGAGKFVTDIEFGGKDAKDVINEVTDGGYDDYLNRNKTDDTGGDSDPVEQDPCKGPNPPAYCFVNQDDADDEDNTNTGGLALRFRKDGGRINAMDGGMMSPEGGIMDLETGRQMYFLGKLVKKATRAVKKIVKSPIGKAAILGGAMYFGGPKLSSFFGKGTFFGTGFNPLKDSTKIGPMSSGLGKFLSKFGLTDFVTGDLTKKGLLSLGGGALALSPFLFQGDDDEEDLTIDRGPGLDIAAIRANPYDFLGQRFRAEEGGKAEPVAKKTMPLLDMGGKEMDLREDGGFVPIGRMEKADDVPARLSKNEFVFTADAVRNAGEGDVDKGAEVMYNMMKNLESGGEVSEESQGLSGARKMFQTSKRLEEVL
jgi:hypothetical protein